MARARGLRRGQAAASILGALAIVALTVSGMIALTTLYTQTVTGLYGAAEAAQAPQLALVDVVVDSNGTIHAVVQNRGGEPVQVRRAIVMAYDSRDTPHAGLVLDVGETLAVGGTLELEVNAGGSVQRYYWWGRPLRVMLDTDKGPTLAGYAPVAGRATVNLHIPTYANPKLVETLIQSLENTTSSKYNLTGVISEINNKLKDNLQKLAVLIEAGGGTSVLGTLEQLINGTNNGQPPPPTNNLYPAPDCPTTKTTNINLSPWVVLVGYEVCKGSRLSWASGF